MLSHLVEIPVEAVFVVGNGGDEGEHQAAAAPDLAVARAVLCVLPQGAVVFFVHAYRLLDDHGFPCHVTCKLALV